MLQMFTLALKIIFFHRNVPSNVILSDEFYVIKEIVHGYFLFGECDIFFTSMPSLLLQY